MYLQMYFTTTKAGTAATDADVPKCQKYGPWQLLLSTSSN